MTVSNKQQWASAGGTRDASSPGAYSASAKEELREVEAEIRALQSSFDKEMKELTDRQTALKRVIATGK